MGTTPNLRKSGGNEFSTTLDASLAAGATSMTLNSVSGLGTEGGMLVIDEGQSTEEKVYWESRSGNILTIASDGRGRDGTSDVSHDAGASVTAILTSEQWDGVIDVLQAQHTDSGGHVVPNDTAYQAKDSGGTARDVVKIDSSDVLRIGQSTGVDSAFATRVKARAYLSVDQDDISTSTWTKVLLNTENYDLGSNFSNYKFTVPINGYYHIIGNITFDEETGSDGTIIGCGIGKNGTVITAAYNHKGDNGVCSVNSSDIRYLQAGDYIELYAFTDMAGSVQDISGKNTRTFMAVHLLSID